MSLCSQPHPLPRVPAGFRDSGLTFCPHCREDLSTALTNAGIPPPPPSGFSTVEVCDNDRCSRRGRQMCNPHWTQGEEIDVVNSDSHHCQECHGPLSISKLRFQRCHAQLVMRMQSPSGSACWSTRDEYVSDRMDIPLDKSLENWVCRVSTASSPKLRPPPIRKMATTSLATSNRKTNWPKLDWSYLPSFTTSHQ